MALPDFVPFGKYFTSEKLLKIFSPEQMEEFFQNNQDSIGIFGSGLTSGNALETYLEESVKNEEAFSAIKVPGGSLTVAEKLKEKLPGENIVRDMLVEALKPSDAMEKAPAIFKQKIEELNPIVTNGSFNSKAIAGYLQELKSSQDTDLKAEQKTQKEALDKLFQNKNFTDNFKTSLGLTDDKQVDTLKQEMTSTLATKHKTDLDKFHSAMDADINGLFNHSKNEKKRISFLAALAAIDDDNKKAIEDLAEKNRPPRPTSLSVNFDGDGQASFTGVRVQDLLTIQTLTGRTMEYKPKKDDKGVEQDIYKMQLPKWGLTYYHSRHQNMLYDMTNIAQAIRACGHESITMSVTYNSRKKDAQGNPDQSFVMEMGRKAYEGAVKAGFPPEKVTVEVNGKAMKAEELFVGYEDTLAIINARAQTQNEKREQLSGFDAHSKGDVKALKDFLVKSRASQVPIPPQQSNAQGPGLGGGGS